MEKLMANENLWNIHELIFQDLDHDTLENCRKVCKTWNKSESLEKIILRNKFVKFTQDFGDKIVGNRYPKEKVSAFIPGWDKAVEKYGAQASIDDLQEIKDSLQKLVRDNGQCREYPVHQAARSGDVKLMDLILKTSYDWNARGCLGWTALHEACVYGKTEIVQLLITSSKDFNIDLNTRDDNGWTPLHMACINGKTEIVQLLITSSKDFNIDLNARDDNGSTPFHMACVYGKTEIVRFLITSSKDFNIDLNARDDEGMTAFHEACVYGKTEIFQLMLKNWEEFGLDIKAQNNQGKTPIDYVKERTQKTSRYSELKDNLEQVMKMLEMEYSKMDVQNL